METIVNPTISKKYDVLQDNIRQIFNNVKQKKVEEMQKSFLTRSDTDG